MINKRKIVFTIDVDAFFAQVEEKENPFYLNKPIGIGMILNKKGVLTTCNYVARKKGIHSGQPIYRALKLEPNLIIIEPRYDYYALISEKIFSIIGKYSNKMEVASIDECFLDVTDRIKLGEDPIQYAKKIQQEIFNKLNITVSIGVSENKVLSKIASSFNKPFGIATLFKNELQKKLWPLELEKMYGIGFRTAIKFRALNINKIGELANINPEGEEYQILRQQIGINFIDLIKKANGIDNSEITDTYHFVKSISYAKTFPFPIKDYENLTEEILESCKILVTKLKYRNLLAKVVAIQTKNKITTRTIKFQDESFKLKGYQTTQKTLKEPTDNLEIIYAEVISLIDNWYNENLEINYIGIKVANFVERFHYGKKQYIDELFEKEFDDNPINIEKNEVINLINYLNQKVGKEIFSTAYSFNKIKRLHDHSYTSRDTIKFKRWKK